jgi:catechol 2,3-dioxygenase-like lactoylglutathione lyase family enzyme
MLSIGSVVLGVEDVRRAVAFWTAALGYVPRDDIDDGWAVLVPADGPGPRVSLGRSETPVEDKPRVHLDLYAGDAADQAAQVERLLGLGARRVDWAHYPPGADFVVLADTEGNRFCVIDTGRG